MLKHHQFDCQYATINLDWEKGLLPETIQLSYLTKINYNFELIRQNFKNNEEFQEQVIDTFLNIKCINEFCYNVTNDMFKFYIATYSYEYNSKSLLPFKNWMKDEKCSYLGWYLNFSSKDEIRLYDIDTIISNANDIISKFNYQIFNPQNFKYIILSSDKSVYKKSEPLDGA